MILQEQKKNLAGSLVVEEWFVKTFAEDDIGYLLQ
jgi:hypothetical protein